jgi:hypothetical protein
MAASSSLESEALARELIHGVAFSVLLSRGSDRAGRSDDLGVARLAAKRTAADDGGVGLTAPDIELAGLVYEVLVEPVDCTICGAQLDPAVNVQLTRGYFTAARIVIATHCRGWEPHPHTESGRTSRPSALWATPFRLMGQGGASDARALQHHQGVWRSGGTARR